MMSGHPKLGVDIKFIQTFRIEPERKRRFPKKLQRFLAVRIAILRCGFVRNDIRADLLHVDVFQTLLSHSHTLDSFQK